MPVRGAGRETHFPLFFSGHSLLIGECLAIQRFKKQRIACAYKTPNQYGHVTFHEGRNVDDQQNFSLERSKRKQLDKIILLTKLAGLLVQT